MRCLSIVVLAASLIGCAGTGAAPSLAPRAVERLAEAAPRPALVARPAGSELTARLAAIVERARAGDRAIDLPPAERERLRARLAAAPESEAWIAAQVRRSALVSARGGTSDALTELDALLLVADTQAAIDAAVEGADAIRAARGTVAAMLARQNALLDGL